MTAKVPSLFDKAILWWPGEHVAQAAAPKTITPAGDAKQILPFRGAGVGIFNGSGSYAKCNYSPGFEPGSGPFTVECLFYVPNVSGYKTIFAFTADYHFGIVINGSKINYFASSNGTSWNLLCGDGGSLNGAGANTITAGVWHHLAFTRSGNNWYGFYDGKLDLSVTVSGTIVSRSETLNIGRWGNNGYWMNGYITEFNYVIGTCKYSAPFVPVKAQVKNDSYTKLLLHFLNPLTDSSNNNLKINPSGSFTLSNTYPSPITTNSMTTVFGGASHMSTQANTSDILGISCDNWTFETYILFTSSIIDNNILFMGNESNDSDRFQFIQYYGPTFSLGAGYGYSITDSTSGTIRWQAIATPQLNTWYHIALVKTGLNVELYINGQIQTKTTGTTLSANIPARVGYPLIIGKYRQSYYHFQGMLSECRFSNVSRYAESFTPSTTRYVADANTKLLMHLDRIPGVIDDYSPTPKQITAYGDAKQLCSPCGSGIAYFDGTGDYLTVPASSDFNFGSNNFTIEFDLYLEAITSTSQVIFVNRSATYQYSGIFLYVGNTADLRVAMSSNGSSWDIANWVQLVPILSIKTQYHIALVRNGSIFTCYLNGVASSTTITSSASIYYQNAPVYIGTDYNGTDYPLYGRLSEFRISNVARYTANFTPSTQPFKPDPYTKLLLHMDGVGNAFYDSSDPPGDNGFPILPDGVTITPAGTFTSVKGKDGRSYWKFDGSTNRIQLSTHALFYLESLEWTLCLWAYRTSNKTSTMFVTWNTATAIRWELTTKANGTLYTWAYNGSGYPWDINVTTGFALNTWTHITLVNSSTAFKIYMDGLQVYTGTKLTMPSIPTPLTRIGDSIDESHEYFPGIIKDVMLFRNKALSQDQIAALIAETYIY